MAQSYSFDIVSQLDRQELKNALDQTTREIATRYDLKDTKTEIAAEESRLVITTDGELTLKSVRDLLESKFVRRGLSLKVLDYGKVEPAAGGRVRQEIALKQGIGEELAREITKKLRADHKKVQGQIQGDAIRVTAKVKDDLQGVIQDLKAQDYPVPLQFINYR